MSAVQLGTNVPANSIRSCDRCQSFQSQVAHLERELEYERQLRQKAEERLAERSSEWQWREELHAQPTKQLKAAEKLVMHDLRAIFCGRQKYKTAPDAPIYIADRVKKVGLSRKTYGDALQTLAAGGAIEREERRKNGHCRVIVRPTARFWEPSKFDRPQERGYGYHPRLICQNCGPDEEVIERRTVKLQVVCAGCGSILEEEKERVTEKRLSGVENPNGQVVAWIAEGAAASPDPNRQLVGLVIEDTGEEGIPRAGPA